MNILDFLKSYIIEINVEQEKVNCFDRRKKWSPREIKGYKGKINMIEIVDLLGKFHQVSV